MKVFITGVAGFLGSHLADSLINQGVEVVGVDNLVGGQLKNVNSKVEFHQEDCGNLEKMNEYMKECDVVFHAACTAHDGLSLFSPYYITQNTFGITMSVLSAAAQNKIKKFIYCSSMSRYGEQETLPFIEALLLHSSIPQKEPSTFENFDFNRVNGENAVEIRNLPNLTTLYTIQNIAFIGPPGVGKTNLSMAYGSACCRKGLKAYFIKATELNEKFTKARRTGTESSAISGLVRPSCLIIDEIGRSIFDMENTRLFFDMIDRRCSKEGPNCMIFISNLTPDKWRDFFWEEDSLLCALDRTFDAATVYLMKGESYRGRNLKTYSIEVSDPTE